MEDRSNLNSPRVSRDFIHISSFFFYFFVPGLESEQVRSLKEKCFLLNPVRVLNSFVKNE